MYTVFLCNFGVKKYSITCMRWLIFFYIFENITLDYVFGEVVFRAAQLSHWIGRGNNPIAHLHQLFSSLIVAIHICRWTPSIKTQQVQTHLSSVVLLHRGGSLLSLLFSFCISAYTSQDLSVKLLKFADSTTVHTGLFNMVTSQRADMRWNSWLPGASKTSCG